MDFKRFETFSSEMDIDISKLKMIMPKQHVTPLTKEERKVYISRIPTGNIRYFLMLNGQSTITWDDDMASDAALNIYDKHVETNKLFDLEWTVIMYSFHIVCLF